MQTEVKPSYRPSLEQGDLYRKKPMESRGWRTFKIKRVQKYYEEY